MQSSRHIGLTFESSAAVNVWILYNEDAGGGVSGESLKNQVELAGHSVVDLVSSDVLKKDEARAPSDRNIELIVAAGGDGTVATAALLASRLPTPVAILPLGTANNIAASLGIDAPAEELMASWQRAHRVPFDLGYARAASKEWVVVEGAGAGLVPAGIGSVHAGTAGGKDAGTVAPTAALRTFHRVLEGLQPRPWVLTIDGTKVSDQLLLVEVLNIRSIGPNLVFSPDATPCDGYFDVVTAGESERDELLAYLQCRIDGQDATLSLPRRRAREVRFDTCDALHIDDERIDTCGLGELSVRIQPAAITMLV